MKQCWRIMAMLVVLVLTAPVRLGAVVQARDSVDIRIVETPQAIGRSPALVTVETDPILQIGGRNGDPQYLFSDISGVALVSGVKIAVVNRATAELRLFDEFGQIAAVRGGRGDGPGEFQVPQLLHVSSADSLVIFDASMRRFTVMSTADDGYRVVPVTPSARAQLVGSPVGMRDGRVLTTVASLPSSRDPGPVSIMIHARLVNLEGGQVDTVALIRSTQVMVTNPGGSPIMQGIPYAPFLRVGVSSFGFLTVAPEAPEIREHSMDGVLQRIIRVLEPPNQVSNAEFQAAVDRLIDQRASSSQLTRRDIAQDYERLRAPDALPSFAQVLVDDHGWLWARRNTPWMLGDTAWYLFDPEGYGAGVVQMPEGLSVEFIGHGLVAGVWKDDLGVEYVRLHRIGGRPGG